MPPPNLLNLLFFFTLIALTAYLGRQKKHPAITACALLTGVLLLVAINFASPYQIVVSIHGISMLITGILLWRGLGVQRVPVLIVGCLMSAFAMSLHLLSPFILRNVSMPPQQRQMFGDNIYLLGEVGFLIFGIGLVLFLMTSLRHYRLS